MAQKKEKKQSGSLIREALSKGNLLSLALVIPLSIAVFRMPEDDLLPFSEGIFDILTESCGLAWGLFVVTLLVSIAVFTRMRKVQHKEIKRISKEKSTYQELLLGRKLNSSDDD